MSLKGSVGPAMMPMRKMKMGGGGGGGGAAPRSNSRKALANPQLVQAAGAKMAVKQNDKFASQMYQMSKKAKISKY